MSDATVSALSPAAAFLSGVKTSLTSIYTLVMLGTFVGISALAHDYGFSLWWLAAATMLMWAGPGQVILITALGHGSPLFEAALAVCLSGLRLLPMVVTLLPLIRRPATRTAALLLPAHITAISMWVESMRLLPPMPREQRLAFTNGLGLGFMIPAHIGSLIGYYLVASLPSALTAGLLFLSPMSFLVSTSRNARMLVDRLALGIGLVVAPLLAYGQIQLDLMWTGIIAGSAAYAIHRLREAMR
jgi:predicted branched-subunit amino acid permease